jgi:hypothetical protein
MLEETKLIQLFAPYLAPVLGTVLLIIFVKKYLFSGMVGVDTLKEQFEREKVLLVQYANILSQLDAITKMLAQAAINAAMAAHKMEDLAQSVDENVINQILRLSEEERAVIKDLRNRLPLTSAPPGVFR